MNISISKKVIDYSKAGELRVKTGDTTLLLLNSTGVTVTGTLASSGAQTITSGGQGISEQQREFIGYLLGIPDPDIRGVPEFKRV